MCGRGDPMYWLGLLLLLLLPNTGQTSIVKTGARHACGLKIFFFFFFFFSLPELACSLPPPLFRFERNKMSLLRPLVKCCRVGSLCDREVACSAQERYSIPNLNNN